MSTLIKKKQSWGYIVEHREIVNTVITMQCQMGNRFIGVTTL